MSVLYIIIVCVEIYLGGRVWYWFHYNGTIIATTGSAPVHVNVNKALTLATLVKLGAINEVAGLPAPQFWAIVAGIIEVIGLLLTNTAIALVAVPLSFIAWHNLNIAAVKEGIIPTATASQGYFSLTVALAGLFSVLLLVQLAIAKHKYHVHCRAVAVANGEKLPPSIMEWVSSFATRQSFNNAREEVIK